MPQTFSQVLDKWYKIFSEMKPGDKIEIAKVAKKNPALFTDICKSFIDENPDFELSNDYRYFKRINNFH